MTNDAAQSDAMHDTLHGFYRAPDAARAVLGLSQFLDHGDLDHPAALYVFARIAMLSPEARRGFEQLRERNPRYIDRVLLGPVAGDFPRLPVSEIGPAELDLLWAEYFVSGEPAPVLQILAVLDGVDRVRQRLAPWLRGQRSGIGGRRRLAAFRPVFARCGFPIDDEHGSIAEGIDLDVLVAMHARDGKLRFDELPIKLSPQECVQIAVKGAAFWSLCANAAAHERIAEICAAAATQPGGAARQMIGPSLRGAG